jgi:hypothetical protein
VKSAKRQGLQLDSRHAKACVPVHLVVTEWRIGHAEAILIVREILPVVLVVPSDHHVRNVGSDGLHLTHENVAAVAIVGMKIVRDVA